MAGTILHWALIPALLTALGAAALVLNWPVEYVVPSLIILFTIGLIFNVIGYRRNQMELSSLKLSQLAVYFTRRFSGNSPISIFVIIEGVFNIDNPRLWDWARGCYASQRILNDWCNSFIERI